MTQPRILEVKPLHGYKLCLVYEPDEKRIFDVTPYIRGNWYGKLKDTAYFNTVRVSGYSVEWSDGQDLAPHELYENSVRLTAF